MSNQGSPSIRFIVNGRRFELTRRDVESRLAGAVPEAIRKHAVQVNDTWFPAIQAFEVATGLPRSEFISHTARRHLASLGFEIAGEIESRTTHSQVQSARAPQPVRVQVDAPGALAGEWHTEANVQAALVTALAGDGWRILSVANTATKERGVDVIASLDDSIIGVEVKGYPSRGYADPARAGEVKPTRPSTQAGHWYTQAVLAAMRLRSREPQWRSVIALPDFQRFRDLHTETSGSLAAAQIEVWWVDRTGTVRRS